MMEIHLTRMGKLYKIDMLRCSSKCDIEAGYQCIRGLDETMPQKDTCAQICGDGLVISRTNSTYCDDGNLSNLDGCSESCEVEVGWTCSDGTAQAPDTCQEICGDGINFGTLACDDGNSLNDDGCSNTCQVEYGFAC
jgi:cysteine-rich repeat protein